MSTTPNLLVTLIDVSQAQKEVSANNAFGIFDAALSEFTKTITNADYTLSTSTTPQEWQYGILNISGTLTANRNIICPAQKKGYILVNNTTGGFTLTLKTPSGTGIAVAAGKTAILRCDSVNVLRVTADT